jgi:hypothetical protein
LREHFDEVEVERWDAPLLELPCRPALRDYLIGTGGDPAKAPAAAEIADIPLSVPERGALALAWKR